MVKILLENNCDPNQMNSKAQSPLMIALETGNYILVDYLINQTKTQITADISHDGKTLLHYFANKSDQGDLIQALLKLVGELFFQYLFEIYFFLSQSMMKLEKWVRYLTIVVEQHCIILPRNSMNFVNNIRIILHPDNRKMRWMN